MKEIEKHINVKRLCAYGLEELILSHVHTTQSNLKFKIIPTKIPMAFFTETEKPILKLV